MISSINNRKNITIIIPRIRNCINFEKLKVHLYSKKFLFTSGKIAVEICDFGTRYQNFFVVTKREFTRLESSPSMQSVSWRENTFGWHRCNVSQSSNSIMIRTMFHYWMSTKQQVSKLTYTVILPWLLYEVTHSSEDE